MRLRAGVRARIGLASFILEPVQSGAEEGAVPPCPSIDEDLDGEDGGVDGGRDELSYPIDAGPAAAAIETAGRSDWKP